MGYFDEMKAMLGRGMNTADRKTQEIRLQAELSRISSDLESAYSALGRVVYAHPTLATQVHGDCPGEYEAITGLLRDEQIIRERMEELRRLAVAPPTFASKLNGRLSCPKCGAQVTLDLSYCSQCGDNLFELKRQYRLCKSCGTYHTADSVFCIQCGSRTMEIPVAPDRQSASKADVASPNSDMLSNTTQPVGPMDVVDDSKMSAMGEGGSATRTEPEVTSDSAQVTAVPSAVDVSYQPAPTPTCPNCGSAVGDGDTFCGECGTRLVG